MVQASPLAVVSLNGLKPMKNAVRWHPLPIEYRRIASEADRAVLLETARPDSLNERSLLFVNPVRELVAESMDDLDGLLREVDSYLLAGYFVAGFFAYECGEQFLGLAADSSRQRNLDHPLAWLGVYQDPILFDHRTGIACGGPPVTGMVERAYSSNPCLKNESLRIARRDYESKIARVHEYLLAGHTYQVNFTDKVYGTVDANPLEVYNTLLSRQPVSFAAYVNRQNGPILSFSPELFYRTSNGHVTVRPMKGTWARGLNIEEDREAARALRDDEKNRAEHITIVDLLRNDVGSICEPGSVRVDRLLEVEHYATLLQMTSTVSGRLCSCVSPSQVFRHLFPSGSITGAPKRRTMEIIRELEFGPRGIYTGAIGYFGPGGEACFNVAIRTLDIKGNRFSMGVGGGITADSCASEEFKECEMKAHFLDKQDSPFSLIETMRCAGGIALLSRHLKRLADSAAYFGIPYDEDLLRQDIEAAVDRAGNQESRIRLEVDRNGKWQITCSPLDASPWCGKILLADARTSSTDVFLRHKTTNRGFYDRQRSRAIRAGFDEVIFLNERSQLTEGSVSNVFLEVEGRWVTPALSSGVLAGVQRAAILAEHPDFYEESVDLKLLCKATAIRICNALRGLRAVKIVQREDGSILWKSP